jgi:hypothetical protein
MKGLPGRGKSRSLRNVRRLSMSLAHHPYLFGSPHRMDDVESTYKDMLARPRVACWTGEQILDWYLGQQN